MLCVCVFQKFYEKSWYNCNILRKMHPRYSQNLSLPLLLNFTLWLVKLFLLWNAEIGKNIFNRFCDCHSWNINISCSQTDVRRPFKSRHLFDFWTYWIIDCDIFFSCILNENIKNRNTFLFISKLTDVKHDGYICFHFSKYWPNLFASGKIWFTLFPSLKVKILKKHRTKRETNLCTVFGNKHILLILFTSACSAEWPTMNFNRFWGNNTSLVNSWIY